MGRGVTPLVLGPEPVPVAPDVRGSRLFGVGDDERVLFSKLIHPCASREVRRDLAATVQHDEERDRLTGVTGRNVQVVRSGTAGVHVSQVADLATRRTSNSRGGGARTNSVGGSPHPWISCSMP